MNLILTFNFLKNELLNLSLPFGQDDPEKKPCSLMADFTRIGETVEAALEGQQLQPVLLRRP